MNLIPEPDLCLINYQGFFKKMKLLLFLISGTKKNKAPKTLREGNVHSVASSESPLIWKSLVLTPVASRLSAVIQIMHAWTCRPLKPRTTVPHVPLWTPLFHLLSGNSWISVPATTRTAFVQDLINQCCSFSQEGLACRYHHRQCTEYLNWKPSAYLLTHTRIDGSAALPPDYLSAGSFAD